MLLLAEEISLLLVCVRLSSHKRILLEIFSPNSLNEKWSRNGNWDDIGARTGGFGYRVVRTCNSKRILVNLMLRVCCCLVCCVCRWCAARRELNRSWTAGWRPGRDRNKWSGESRAWRMSRSCGRRCNARSGCTSCRTPSWCRQRCPANAQREQ